MPFRYNPPTRTSCVICEKTNGDLKPIIDSSKGRASSADKFPLHNWYNFVLGYTPEFPDYVLQREKAKKNSLILDPFMGSGTTLLCCKTKGIRSIGVEANDFFKFAADVKLNWDININDLLKSFEEILSNLELDFSSFDWTLHKSQTMLLMNKKLKDPISFANKNRSEELPARYISDIPLTKLVIIKTRLEKYSWPNNKIKDLFFLALASIVLPVSNIRYGPGFGVIKPRENIDVLSLFRDKMKRIITDIKLIQEKRELNTKTYLGDARTLSKHLRKNSVDLMITSPPYPGDHEYTKHSKLELIFLDIAKTLDDFRVIKKRMLRGSTTNVYKGDNEGDLIKDITSIQNIVSQINQRIKEDNGTSGFEKLYGKLVFEYFGGMYKVFQEALSVLKPGGKFVLLISDSHAFKMVHIETAKILQEIAEKAGFCNSHIELWQYKNTTSHKYKLLENILTVQKPKVRQ